MTALPDDPQILRVAVDVSGLPATMALARAARDVIDHAEDAADAVVDSGRYALLRIGDLVALSEAVESIYPGAAT